MGRLQIDHIQLVAKDGSDDDDNLCLACELCNQHKWAKTQLLRKRRQGIRFGIGVGWLD